ncbi:MAG TPA: cupin domain-containing protein [Blastocatellia bacterium]|nr:cupin domain-containing protein [Blastocatellia bacterium]
MTTNTVQAIDQNQSSPGLLARRDIPKPAHPEITGRELSELLAPISPEVFEKEYWGRKPLFIKGGVEKLERILPGGFGLEDFFRGTREAESQQAPEFQLCARTSCAETDHWTYIRSEEIDKWFADGANIASVNLSDPRVVTLAAALKTQLKLAGEIHFGLALSPEGNGWPVHVDHSDAISLQCRGRKKFVYSEEPRLAWPRGSISIASDGSPEAFNYNPLPWEEEMRVETGELHEVVLEPGDVFYFPAGILHTTKSLSSSSLTLNFALNHPSFFDVVMNLVRNRLLSNPDWRHLPVVEASSLQPGKLPQEMAEFFAARLKELSREIESLEPAGLALNREWQKLLAEPGEHISVRLAMNAESVESGAVERQDVLRPTLRGVTSYAVGVEEDGSTAIYLYMGRREVSLYNEWVPFIRTMFQQESFVAEVATQWADGAKPYPWETTQEYLQILLSEGFLERVTV